jgi:hypothetical protein
VTAVPGQRQTREMAAREAEVVSAWISHEADRRSRFYGEDLVVARASVVEDVRRRSARMRTAVTVAKPAGSDEFIMGSDAARAIGRFNPDGLDGYQAASAPNAPLRATREEAVDDERVWREEDR